MPVGAKHLVCAIEEIGSANGHHDFAHPRQEDILSAISVAARAWSWPQFFTNVISMTDIVIPAMKRTTNTIYRAMRRVRQMAYRRKDA